MTTAGIVWACIGSGAVGFLVGWIQSAIRWDVWRMNFETECADRVGNANYHTKRVEQELADVKDAVRTAQDALEKVNAPRVSHSVRWTV